VVRLTEWQEHVDMDPELIGDLVSLRCIDCLNRAGWRAADWNYPALGPRS
jgi:UDPglucose 6-dehydrogenase